MTATGMSFRFGRAQHDHTVRLQRLPLSSMPVEYLAPAIEDGAVEALALLAGRGQHRPFHPLPDHRRHCRADRDHCPTRDKDFEIIAQITPIERLATP
jgi:hypothetical protein